MNPHYSALVESLVQFALSRSKAAAELMHSGLIGRAREIFARDLLTPFLSPNLGTCTGIVVDSHGGSSRQIDIIIYDKTLIPSLMFTGDEGIVPIESVLATIEVKSKLTRVELKKAVENARSVKTLRTEFAEVMPESRDKSSPVCCLFAFDSDSNPESERNRLENVVAEANHDSHQKVYVPLSGICVGDNVFLYCKTIDENDPPVAIFEHILDRAATRFMVFLIDQASILERQRSKMLISHYFLERPAGERTTTC
jgi:hypothetical protein